LRLFPVVLFAAALVFGTGCTGDDGDDGRNGKDGADGADGLPALTVIDAGQVSDEFLADLDVVAQVTGITIASPPVVTFTLESSSGIPITGIVPFWEDSNRYVRFTLTKLVPGTGTEPNNWVSYTRDATSGEPDYDTGASLVDNGDGSYTFTFLTDVTNVPGILWEPTLTHRLAGQLGSRNPPLEPQNFVHDFVPDGSAVTLTRRIATMDSCNECHDDLVFHGRRFLVEYCVNCHNPDLASGEGHMPFMIHKIHNSGTFAILDDAIDFSHLTYPQAVNNCRKCHNGDDAATPDGNNWKEVPNAAACDGCHENFTNGTHTAGPQPDSSCKGCHSADQIEEYHVTPNATPNNPNLVTDQRNITYELLDASVNAANEVTINFRILSDGTPLDLTALPQDLLDGNRYPSFLLAFAMPQSGIMEPMDYNNMGNRGAQPTGVGIDDLSPLETDEPVGTLSYDGASGVNTAVITDGGSQFPVGATLRAVGLQSYLRQDLDGDGAYDVSLHTPSAVVAVTGDDERRTVIDNANCSNCHEWFEGHGGNRTYNIQICTLCHNPNLSSSGRTVTDPTGRGLDGDIQDALDDGTLDQSVDPDDPLTYPEDAQNLKDLVHGIHSSGFRTRPFQHVRGGRQGYYDWSHVTFPRGASTSNCKLCHKDGTYELPLAADLLPSTVRTTGIGDGQDASVADAETAFQNVPNDTDWINTPTAASCVMCHTGTDAMAHMTQNGALLSEPSVPIGNSFVSRILFGTTYESCTVCHGPGKLADIEEVHEDE
jgi:OmcA/MtrC family decaheme c-type cytochrome